MRKFTLLICVLLSFTVLIILSSCGSNEPPVNDDTQSCTVTFDSNGGTEVTAQNVEMNKKATEPTAPTRAGYTFNGWYMGEEKWSFIGYVVTEDMTLVAKWTANENTLSFNANGGEGTLASVAVATDSQVNLTANAFARTGYTFIGWSTSASGSVEYTDGASYTMGACDTTLYAVWQAIDYDVTYELNGGTNNEKNPSKYNIEQSFELESPTKDGYTFAGWYIDSGFTTAETSIDVGATGDKTFYAKWTPNENALVFDANGGNGTMASMTLATGSSSVLGGCTYTKDGYTFKGWSINASGGVEYETGDTYVMGTRPSYTLYAVWQANNNTLVFDANGGSGSMKNMVALTDSSVTLTCNAFERAGYTFKGWSTTKDGALEYGDCATYTMGTSSINTLYAVWQANENTLAFDSNGGSGTMANMTIVTDSQAKLPANTFEKVGYTFIGWSSTSDGEVEYLDGASYTMGASSTYTLYAVWQKNINVLIFDGNGATSGTPSTMELETGKTIVLPQNTFAKTGYTFKGWSTERDGAVVYTDGASYTMGTDGTYYLYAVWQANNNTLVFDANGGNGNIDNMTVATDSKVTLPQNTFTRAGYTFKGWATTVGGSVEYINGASYTMGTDNSYTLYAIWQINTYNITYVLNGGTNNTNSTTYTVEQEFVLKAPSKTGYTFDGWYSDRSFNNKATGISLGTVGNKTFYAKWTANENSLVFDANGGSGNMSNMTIATDSTANLTTNAFTKVGYTFKGWATSKGGSVVYADEASYTMGTNSTYTLYAVWEANQNTLSFDANGGTGTMEGMTVATDSTVNLITNAFERNGYTFKGWSTSANGSVVYTNGASYTMGTNTSYTLYAVWELTEYNITYVLNCGSNSQNNPSTYTIEDVATFEAPSDSKGYNDFLGWYTDPNFESRITKIENRTGDITLYAKWATNDTVLTFTEIEGGYSVTDCVTDIDVVIIPETYKGYPVTLIGNGAFQDCTSLTSITIPSSVTSIGSYAFSGCTSLESIIVDENNTAYKLIDGVLYSKDGTTLVCYPAGKKDTSFAIPSSVTLIGSYAFSGCTSLESITIGDSVTSIGNGAFQECTSLTSVTIPESVTSIGISAFFGCTSLESITIGDSVTSIGNGAFQECTSLTSVTIPESVTLIGSYAFSGCTSLESIIVDENNTAYKLIDGVLYSKDGTTLVCYPAGKKDTSFTIPSSVTSIGRDAFYGCTSLTSVTIPESVTSIGSFAFYNCTSLESVIIPSSVMTVGSVAFRFFGPNLENRDVYCQADSKPEGWASDWTGNSLFSPNVHWGVKALCENDEFTYIVHNSDEITITGYKLQEEMVIIPSKIDGLPVTKILANTFVGVDAFVPSSVVTIEKNAFCSSNSRDVNTVYCEVESKPEVWDEYWNGEGNWQSYATEIVWGVSRGTTDDGFEWLEVNGTITITAYNGEVTTSINVPATINGFPVTTIGSSAFACCNSLTSVTIPDSVTSIGSSAFYGCTNLTSVTFKNLNGWKRYRISASTDGITIDSFSISDTSTAAEYLTSIYYIYYWKRS
ncbi:MAG: hypothetical protein E7602_01340 [Ruminococcaceae bacterium]|nr:hypothetical protein [Oscillospiraceae bacterium]